jgi:hypothetical protein
MPDKELYMKHSVMFFVNKNTFGYKINESFFDSRSYHFDIPMWHPHQFSKQGCMGFTSFLVVFMIFGRSDLFWHSVCKTFNTNNEDCFKAMKTI